jgi:metallo-beta-lactamase family protein
MTAILHHGGHQGVTGSCHQLKLANGRSLLIDCGLFQGQDEKRHPSLHIDFPLDGVETLVLTHAHLDHVGRLPYLLSAGFGGRILCTRPTARLLPLIMEDALKIGFTRNRNLIGAFLERIDDHLVPVDYDVWHDVEGNARVKLKRAGHILGSAYVEVDARDQRIVFSGDLGAPYAPLLYAPRSPYQADTVVLESTYGDRLHDGRRARRQRLESILVRTLGNQGATIIPAFSLGRTQELLYELNVIFERLVRRGCAPGDAGHALCPVDVIVDSPLAARFTEVYSDCAPFWDAEAQRRLHHGDQPLVFDNLMTVGTHREHQWVVDYQRKHGKPAIVIAGSGMCTGGRVVNYLEALLPDPRTDVLFVGYQGAGTPGRVLQDGRKTVMLNGKRVSVGARVHTLSGYSAHADQRGLVNFVGRMRRKPREVILVHGERRARETLRGALRKIGVAARLG